MFCYQCEQTAKGGCKTIGVCGKPPEVSALQDLLEHALRGLSVIAVKARQKGISDPEVNGFTVEALFSTLTNVNFDADSTAALVRRAVELREALKEKAKVDDDHEAASFVGHSELSGMIEQASLYGINSLHDDPDVRSLMHTVMYGLKGIAAYAYHARKLGKEDEEVYE
jgi:hydroxylamine reductase